MNHFTPLFQIWGYVAVAATILTLVFYLIRRPENTLIDWLKNFLGALFIFSGAVKAIDPAGTAIKMHDYFDAFGWTIFNDYLLPMAIGMIVLEIFLGINLLLGVWKRLTIWLTIPMMLFFTLLTGYTYLTGYITPEAKGFLDFGHWGAFVDSQMKITDCGCFGDFLKLKPYVSFIKDIILLIVLLPLIFGARKITPVFQKGILGTGLAVLVSAASLVFCFQNYFWNEPIVDFRPFKNGVDLYKKKHDEQAAVAARPMVAIFKNKTTGEIKEFDPTHFPEGMDWSQWESKGSRQIGEEVETTKAREYVVYDSTGAEVSDALLQMEGYQFVIIVPDFRKTDESFFPEINELVAAAQKDSIQSYGIVSASEEEVKGFAAKIKANFKFYTSDDKLLKTMIRSNPGVFLFKKGTIIHKWHRLKLPDYTAIKSEYIK